MQLTSETVDGAEEYVPPEDENPQVVETHPENEQQDKTGTNEQPPEATSNTKNQQEEQESTQSQEKQTSQRSSSSPQKPKTPSKQKYQQEGKGEKQQEKLISKKDLPAIAKKSVDLTSVVSISKPYRGVNLRIPEGGKMMNYLFYVFNTNNSEPIEFMDATTKTMDAVWIKITEPKLARKINSGLVRYWTEDSDAEGRDATYKPGDNSKKQQERVTKPETRAHTAEELPRKKIVEKQKQSNEKDDDEEEEQNEDEEEEEEEEEKEEENEDESEEDDGKKKKKKSRKAKLEDSDEQLVSTPPPKQAEKNKGGKQLRLFAFALICNSNWSKTQINCQSAI